MQWLYENRKMYEFVSVNSIMHNLKNLSFVSLICTWVTKKGKLVSQQQFVYKRELDSPFYICTTKCIFTMVMYPQLNILSISSPINKRESRAWKQNRCSQNVNCRCITFWTCSITSHFFNKKQKKKKWWKVIYVFRKWLPIS